MRAKTPHPVTASQKKGAGQLRDYQVEVLDKLEGHPWRTDTSTHPQAGLFYMLALHAPVQVEAALQATQDQRLRNLNNFVLMPDTKSYRMGGVYNFTKYYLATVRNMCREQGVTVPVRWKQ